MRGLEIARAYWEQFGKPMLEAQFPDLVDRVAVGLTGPGSECFGFDDALSRDHDFEPGFCLFLPGEDVVDRRTAFLLERAYDKLPRVFMGLHRGLMKPAGGPRCGVLRTSEYYIARTGSPDGVLTIQQWLALPSQALAEAINGELFMDGYGEVSRIRAGLTRYPMDIRLKKLSACLMLMAQSGGYNYERCLGHGETGAAQLAVGEYVHRAMEAVFLLNETYMPFYKWRFRAMRQLPRLSLLAELMEYLLTTGNDGEMMVEKRAVMAGMDQDIIAEAKRQGLTSAPGDTLEAHARALNDSISDPWLRNLDPLAGVGESSV